MVEYGDASFIFPLSDDVSLLVEDVLMPISRIQHENSGTMATWFDFEARADDGREMIGSLHTRQDRDDVEALVFAAMDQGKWLEIRGRQSVTQVPGTSRFWVMGELRICSGLTQPLRVCSSATFRTLN
ncbi:hypothetical protein B5K08_21795 [Rhizobium leguminosarum bv. trifolii]|uniref:Uncharacterized protein n=1 Tax=Rhizobium leguminosarum bv. trifolii TaxID=386 RepID=A0A3E1B907_RHILT|nr:hypothetical protein [Rhizobium leguminosarum]RFB87914.1 hypothetical protein B5K08_21795 [Rhizobium leguminosarum bv. trifolii]RFB88155.1 hypothetical protein B5K10_21790 [Rhizobium leguminosarum bv. trifolii]